MAVIAVLIKWNAQKKVFCPYDVVTGNEIISYQWLGFGSPSNFPNDDPAVSIQTFANPVIVNGKYKDSSPNVSAVLNGYVVL